MLTLGSVGLSRTSIDESGGHVTTIDCLAKAGFELESPACKDIELYAVGRHFAGTARCGVCMLAAPLGVTWDAVPEQSWLLKLRRKTAFSEGVAGMTRPLSGHGCPRAWIRLICQWVSNTVIFTVTRPPPYEPGRVSVHCLVGTRTSTIMGHLTHLARLTRTVSPVPEPGSRFVTIATPHRARPGAGQVLTRPLQK